MEQQAAFANMSSFLPSPADLLMAVPRLLSRAGALGEHIDSVFGKIRTGGSIIAEPTVANLTNATTATTSGRFVQESIAAAANAGLPFQENMNFFQALKNVGSFFSYMTSKWAIATFSIVPTPTDRLSVARKLIRPFTRPSFSTVHTSTPQAEYPSRLTDSICASRSTFFRCSCSRTAYKMCSRPSAARRIRVGQTCNMGLPGDN